jgi:predicted O-methyltransferase YrrM
MATIPTLKDVVSVQLLNGMGIKSDLQGWNSDHPIFDQLIKETNARIVIEVGTWKGRSAIHMANALPDDGVVYCCDTWLGGFDHWKGQGPYDKLPEYLGYPILFYVFIKNVFNAGLENKIVAIPNTSANCARILGHLGVKADLVYVDGSHEEQDVGQDIFAYWPLVRDGGIMFGDDFGMEGVSNAVKASFSWLKGGKEVVDGNFWVVRKEGKS